MHLDALKRDIEVVTATHEQTSKNLGDVKTSVAVVGQQIDEVNRWKLELGPIADLKSEIAILKRDIEELKKTHDEWGRRLWAMVGPLLGALVGALLTYFLRK